MSLALRGQAERAVAELERVRRIDPLYLPINGTLGRFYRDAGRYDESIDQCGDLRYEKAASGACFVVDLQAL
jgi:hypothetical protein